MSRCERSTLYQDPHMVILCYIIRSMISAVSRDQLWEKLLGYNDFELSICGIASQYQIMFVKMYVYVKHHSKPIPNNVHVCET